VVDAFEVTTDRAYRPSRMPAEALGELRRCARTHFDESAVTAFLTAFPDTSALPLQV
jgi:HD-GYP domain-containing protein (c-di-GMP phosphodiesterase class II)